jgi:hypothetical protein
MALCTTSIYFFLFLFYTSLFIVAMIVLCLKRLVRYNSLIVYNMGHVYYESIFGSSYLIYETLSYSNFQWPATSFSKYNAIYFVVHRHSKI